MKNISLSTLHKAFTVLCLYLLTYPIAYAAPGRSYQLTEEQAFQQAHNFLIHQIHTEAKARLVSGSLQQTFESQSNQQTTSSAEPYNIDSLVKVVSDEMGKFFAKRKEELGGDPTAQTTRRQTRPIIDLHDETAMHAALTGRLLTALTKSYAEKKREYKYLLSKHKAASDKPHEIHKSEIERDERNIIAIAEEKKMFRLARESIQTLPNDQVNAIRPGNADNPENVKRVEKFITAKVWEDIFPMRNPQYTYQNFLMAIGKYPAFCRTYTDKHESVSDTVCKRALVTMFAHFTQETGGHIPNQGKYEEWQQGLYYLRELGWTESMANGYGICSPDTWQGKAYPCGKFPDGKNYKSYFGRGAKQLSYNYNYGSFSQSIFGDVHNLLNAPEEVADTWLNLASAIFFYVFPQPPKPNMLSVVDREWIPSEEDDINGLTQGFGTTTMIINGGVECGGSEEVQQSKNRIEYYKKFAKLFGVDISGEVLGCKGMRQFDARSSGAIAIYWEEDWSWDGENPNGLSYKCQPVSYQTPYSAFVEGDYMRCVKDKFNVVIKDDDGNIPPVADAGEDKRVMANENTPLDVMLNGSNSKAFGEGNTLAYQWTMIDANSDLQLQDDKQAIAKVIVPPRTTGETKSYGFQLRVTDTHGRESLDGMNLLVEPYNGSSNIEVSLAGDDVVVPGEELSIAAEVENADIDKLTFAWIATKGVDYTVADDKHSITLTGPETSSSLDIQVCLEVTDDQGNQGNATKHITVQPSGGHYPAWKEGTVYHGGSRVTVDGKDYECKPFPFSGWCGQSARHYMPGKGNYWKDAWERVSN
ncbi:chitinase [Endozoicomonas montiporae]|uniref:Chitin-binding type-3 domain-containing protein n=1 Tax=Endozoicomonas montiporae CL-33 TaxID=570277 RepID=A0A142BAB7_9GAMM|nr:chitinase [Endozoicomonas montiporae]AMO55693.1 hypothetical protein EZMO1_1527 [Endozoicomonas montiporae CL-33]